MSRNRMGRNPFEKKKASASPSAAAVQSTSPETVTATATTKEHQSAPVKSVPESAPEYAGTVSRLARWVLVDVPAEGLFLGLKAALLVGERLSSGRAKSTRAN